MGTLTNGSIVSYLKDNKLIINARKKADGEFDVEAASYDLSVGIAVKKKHGTKPFQKRHEVYSIDDSLNEKKRAKTITLSPGQMVFVITNEEIDMPLGICGTVYSRNSLALKGILALNAGHIDPCYKGPITIKLINLRSVDFTLKLGDPIFTIVFHTLDINAGENLGKFDRTVTKDEMLSRVISATDESLDNALYDLALLREFVKEREFGRAMRNWFFKTFWGIVTASFALTIALAGGIVSISKLYELIKLWISK